MELDVPGVGFPFDLLCGSEVFCLLVVAPSVFGPTTVTADNCFSCLQKLYRSTWTKSNCHVAGQWSRFNQMRPLVVSARLKEFRRTKAGFIFLGSLCREQHCICVSAQGRISRGEENEPKRIFSVQLSQKITLLKWPAGCSCQPRALVWEFWQHKVNFHVPLSNVTNTEDGTFCAIPT